LVRLVIFLLLGCAASAVLVPAARAQDAPDIPSAETPPPAIDPRTPIISDEEFDKAIPSLDDAPLESIDEWQQAQDAQNETTTTDGTRDQAEQTSEERANPALRDGDVVEALSDPPVIDPLLDTPLPPIDSFDAEPPPSPTEAAEEAARAVRYVLRIDGLDAAANPDVAADPDGDIYRRARSRFNSLSALDKGKGRADSRAEVSQRARADRQLLLDILTSEGFFDATVRLQLQRGNRANGNGAANGNGDAGANGNGNGNAVRQDAPQTVVLTVVPGRRYYLGQIAFDAPAVEPGDLIARNFIPKSGDPIIADTILAAEATIAVKLPENGYPFAKVGQRDILLDGETGLGDYSLPVTPGARSVFGQIRSEGNEAFDADHIATLRRFDTDDLYDERLVDDLRAALVATGLLSTVSVTPVVGEGTAPDGMPYADLLVRQEKGPPRTLAASAGYGTGQGFRADASWTHRNLFPPEGALAVAGLIGTLEQAASVTFTRSNAGKRDRTFEVSLTGLHSNFEAFDAYTGRVAAVYGRVSTPIWQKEITWSAGVELLATYEKQFDFARGVADRRLYYIGALPGQLGFDKSDSLLDPTRGYRLNLRLSPEASLGTGTQFYARAILDGSYYYRVNDSLVIAARGRLGTISGIERNKLAPSRRFYGGGGGSVRGFGYQQLGPKDPNGDPIGGRSTNEAAVEVRYRFGNFGVAGFVDAGQVYESSIPKFDDWRFGVGIGGRFYTNFGPIRLDLATPVNRQPGESRVSVYVSIGQSF
jgi:translocation and assembly module TamA